MSLFFPKETNKKILLKQKQDKPKVVKVDIVGEDRDSCRDAVPSLVKTVASLHLTPGGINKHKCHRDFVWLIATPQQTKLHGHRQDLERTALLLSGGVTGTNAKKKQLRRG